MAQSKQVKSYRTFVKGLVSEASPLTYPEDTSFDELNTVISRKGNRTRRFGMNYNPTNATPRAYNKRLAQGEFMWNAVGSNPGLSFLVVQNGAQLTFYDRTKNGFSATIKSFMVDLNEYSRPGISDVSATVCRFASGKGYLFVVNPDMEPIVVTYDKTADDVLVTKIAILARDFEGLRDGLANDEEPGILTKEHFYNLRNQGWIKPDAS